jgi:hypothetical protein
VTATIEAAPTAPQTLVPQNPVLDEQAPAATPQPETAAAVTETTAADAPPAATAEAPAAAAEASAAAAEPTAAPRRTVKRRPAKHAQKGPGSGTLEMLFQGPGK